MKQPKDSPNAKANELAAIRKAANRQLLQVMEYALERYPSQRFSQMLINFGFVIEELITQDLNMKPERAWRDEHNLEPEALLRRVRARVKEIQKAVNIQKPIQGEKQ